MDLEAELLKPGDGRAILGLYAFVEDLLHLHDCLSFYFANRITIDAGLPLRGIFETMEAAHFLVLVIFDQIFDKQLQFQTILT